MKISKEFIEEIKKYNPIEDVVQEFMENTGSPFENKGGQIFAHHHIWKNKSNKGTALYITPSNQMWHCFSCKETGNVISLVQSFLFGDEFNYKDKQQFIKALKYLADRSDIPFHNYEDLEDDSFELYIIHSIFQDFIEYCIKNSFSSKRKDEIIEYIQDRYPLTEETILNFKICYFDRAWTKPFFNKLREKYSEEELLSSGLFKKYNEEITATYQNRIIIPYIQSGTIVYLIGREVKPNSGWEDNTGKWVNFDRGGKFKKHPIKDENNPQISEYLNNNYIFGYDYIKTGQDLFITEGIGDCLTLLQENFKAISPVTTSFKNEMLDPISKKLSRVRNIYICNDNEISGAGDKGAIKMAEYFIARGLDAKIVELPRAEDISKIDIADYFKLNSKEDFKELVESAKSYIDKKIELLDDQAHKLDIEPLWNLILSLNSFEQDTYKSKLAKKLNKTVKKLNDAFGVKKQTSSTSKILFKVSPQITPAIHFEKDSMGSKFSYTTQYLPLLIENDSGDSIETLTPHLITSEIPLDGKTEISIRNLVSDPLTPLEMKKVPDAHMFNRWRVEERFPYSLYNLLQNPNPNKPNPEDVFNRIYTLYDEFFWYPNNCEKLIQTLYVMLSYFHTLFDALPILHFTGLFGAGKSNSMKIMELIGFNAISTYNVNPAFIYRSSHTKRGVLIIDEGEEFDGSKPSDRIRDIMTLLRGRYKNGLSVPRTERIGDTFVDVFYESFGPTLVGSVKPLEQGLTSRAIIIQCLKKDDSVKIKDFINYHDEIEAECLNLRDELYTLMMLDFHNVMRAMNFIKEDKRIKHIINREYEKWFPMFCIAHYIDVASKNTKRNLVDELVEIKKMKEQLKIDTNTSTNIELNILEAIKFFMEKNATETNMKVFRIGQDDFQFPYEQFYGRINDRLILTSAQKKFDSLPRSEVDQILRQTHIWGPGDGKIEGGKITIRASKLEAAIDRLKTI